LRAASEGFLLNLIPAFLFIRDLQVTSLSAALTMKRQVAGLLVKNKLGQTAAVQI
jgi:hypothetical protein